ncbi:MAG: hypothetical protein PHP76_00855 [Bacteroidales bacterium]|nr:hypothetical protein [Bacteroidales bacterium]
MKHTFMIIAFTGLLLTVCTSAFGQSKSEVKQYNSALKKGTVKAYDKFLKRYDKSIYYPAILYKRDSILYASCDHSDVLSVMQFVDQNPNSPLLEEAEELITRLNTSSLSVEEASSVFSSFFHAAAEDQTPQLLAVGRRHLNVDYITGIALGESGVPASHYRIYTLRDNQGIWLVDTVADYAKHSFGEGMVSSEFADDIGYVSVVDRILLSFSYLNHDAYGRKIEYVTNLLDLESGHVMSAGFNGNNILLAKESSADTVNHQYLIEGQSPDLLSSGMTIPETAFLLNKININPGLVMISKSNAITDKAVEWWYSKNPKAETSARSINFGIISTESSLVAQYLQESKEKSRTYNAALFNIRGNTVICAYSKRSKEYLLVWCEPQAQDKRTDKLLNTIYFEGDNVLNLFYYKGNQTFKIRINLANKSVRR